MLKKLLLKDEIVSYNAVTILKDGTYFSAFQHKGRVVKSFYRGGIEVTTSYTNKNKRINRYLKIKGVKEIYL